MNRDNFVKYLRRFMLDWSYDQKDCAAKLGVSPQYLNDVLCGRKEPGNKILKPLGFERVVSYRKKP